jgi:5-methylcytosine-specific restriction endonuclease McrA
MSPVKNPIERARYPKDWKAISQRIRARADGQCECAGECGLHRDHPGPRRCTERNGEPAQWARGKVMLTVAHLNHTPEDCRPENLKAMCQRCHLRYDRDLHAVNSAATRRKKKNNGELFPIADYTPAIKGASFSYYVPTPNPSSLK